jgi:hypothetical protein
LFEIANWLTNQPHLSEISFNCCISTFHVPKMQRRNVDMKEFCNSSGLDDLAFVENLSVHISNNWVWWSCGCFTNKVFKKLAQKRSVEKDNLHHRRNRKGNHTQRWRINQFRSRKHIHEKLEESWGLRIWC